MPRPKLMFSGVGMLLWTIAGSMVVMSCFQPVVPLETVQANAEVAQKISDAWGKVAWRVVPIWACTGAILGFITFLLLVIRPSHEHLMRISPGVSGTSHGFKTMAEMRAAFQSLFLGLILGVCGTIFVLPYLQNDTIVVKELWLRAVIGGVLTLTSTFPILPFSLNRLRKQAISMGYR